MGAAATGPREQCRPRDVSGFPPPVRISHPAPSRRTFQNTALGPPCARAGPAPPTRPRRRSGSGGARACGAARTPERGGGVCGPRTALTFLLGIVQARRARAGCLRAAARREPSRSWAAWPLPLLPPPELLRPAAGAVGEPDGTGLGARPLLPPPRVSRPRAPPSRCRAAPRPILLAAGPTAPQPKPGIGKAGCHSTTAPAPALAPPTPARRLAGPQTQARGRDPRGRSHLTVVCLKPSRKVRSACRLAEAHHVAGSPAHVFPGDLGARQNPKSRRERVPSSWETYCYWEGRDQVPGNFFHLCRQERLSREPSFACLWEAGPTAQAPEGRSWEGKLAWARRRALLRRRESLRLFCAHCYSPLTLKISRPGAAHLRPFLTCGVTRRPRAVFHLSTF